MSNLQQLNSLAQEIANALGTIDLDLLKKIHALATGATTCTSETVAAEETAVS
jgi:hypothetical protein